MLNEDYFTLLPFPLSELSGHAALSLGPFIALCWAQNLTGRSRGCFLLGVLPWEVRG